MATALDDLDQMVHRETAEENAMKAIVLARSRLMVGRPMLSDKADKDTGIGMTCFFATLALKLKLVPDWTLPTAAVDGRHLYYNPDFINSLKPAEVMGVVVHECMHIANKHHVRRQQRDMPSWNEACDLAINGMLKKAGFVLPQGGIYPGEGPYSKMPPDLCAEEYYNRLPKKPRGDGDGSGEGDGEGEPNPDPGGSGGIKDPGDGSASAIAESEAETDVELHQAMQVAKRRGKMPASLERLVTDAVTPKVDWRHVLREFISKLSKNDYAWFPPNRRFIHMGLYLPGLRSEELGDICVCVDTSGSIGEHELNAFAAEIQSILECYDTHVTIIYHDSDVAGTQEWSSSDGPLILEPKGGGGTSHEWMDSYFADNGLEPTAIVCLTDMCSSFGKGPGNLPVIFCSTVKGQTAPFGVVLDVEI